MLRSECTRSGLCWGPLGILTLLLAIGANRAFCQETRLEMERPPDESAVFLSIEADLKSLRSDKRIGLLPWEVYSVYIQKTLGIDLLSEHVVQMDLAYREGKGWIAAIVSSRCSELQAEDLSKRWFTIVKDASGVKREGLRRFADSEIFVKKAENAWYVGTDLALDSYLESGWLPIPKTEGIAGASQSVFSIALKPSAIRETLMASMESYFDELDSPELEAVLYLCRNVEEARVELFLGDSLSVQVSVRGAENVSARDIAKRIRMLQQPSIESLQKFVQIRADKFRLSQREQFAWGSYVDRLQRAVEVADPEIEGNRAIYEIGILLKVPMIALWAQDILDTLEYERLSNERFSALYKLREIKEAIEKYIKERGSFPLREILSEQGDSLLSWRVALLPYLGYETLYQKFHLDEPWDSPNNRALLEQMPSIYRDSDTELGDGYTTFVAPYGGADNRRKTVWDIVPQVLHDIPEGERGSILLIEVNAEAAVPWTSPDDINITQQDLRGLLRDPPAGNGVLYTDGDTDWISNAITTIKLLELLKYSAEQGP